MENQAQVIVAGAGPVGLSLALSLAKKGIRVDVYEALDELSDEARASTLHPPTLEMFEEWGVLPEILKRGEVIDRLQYWDRVDRSLVAEFSYDLIAKETRYPFRFQCPQSVVTPVLKTALESYPNARVFMGHAFSSFEADDEGVTVTLSTANGDVVRRADYLCGCDGASSAVRGTLDLPLQGSTYEDRFLLIGTNLDVAKYFPKMGPVSYVFDPEEWVIVMRLPNLVRTVFRLAPGADADAAMEEPAIRERLTKFLGEEANYDILMRSVYRVHRRVADSFRVGRVLLAGDAAHINNPAGGMGMNSGIHDAYHLADALIRVYAGEPESWLDAYSESRRQAAMADVQKTADNTYKRLVTKGDEARAARNKELSDMASDLEKARAFLMTASMLDQPVGQRASL